MPFTDAELHAKLTGFLALPTETEWVEFKEAKRGYDFDDHGRYFSALSNEANLKGQDHGWLVFGVKDQPLPREIVGSQYRPHRANLDSLKHDYTRILMTQTSLVLMDVIALDKVQKKLPITDDELRSLKAKKLVEGRRPNLFVSAKVAEVTGDRAAYIRNRAFDKEHYKKLVLGYLKQFGAASREDIDGLLLNKLSDALDERQKKTFVTNLLQEMRRQGSIRPGGTTRWVKWVISGPTRGDQN